MEVERCAHSQHHRWNAFLMCLHPSLLLGTADTYEQDTCTRGQNLLRYCFVFLGCQRTKVSSRSGVPPYSPIGMPSRAARSTTCVVRSVPRTWVASLTPKLLSAQTRGLPSGVIRSAPFTTR